MLKCAVPESGAILRSVIFFFFQAEDGIRDFHVTGVQTCALPISPACSEGTDPSLAHRCARQDNGPTQRSAAMHGQPHVVIVGGGFAGLWATRALARDAVRITLVDRRNHHLFQPLLYQVATAGLSAPDIAAPLRHILRRQGNVEVRLGEVTAIDTAGRQVRLADGGVLDYDFLLLASGATHVYFGHDDWATAAPGLKTLEDALAIRRR